MKRTITLAVALLVSVLSGCKMNITADLYTSDIQGVADGEYTNLTTPVFLAFEIPSTRRCDEYVDRVTTITEGLFEFTPKGCENIGSDSFLNVETQMPIVTLAQSSEITPLIATIVGIRDGKAVAILYLDKEKYKALNDRSADEFRQRINLQRSKIKMVLNNDLRHPIEFVVNGVFLDNEPVHSANPQSFTLERRRQAEIVMSNVGAALLERRGAVFVSGISASTTEE